MNPTDSTARAGLQARKLAHPVRSQSNGTLGDALRGPASLETLIESMRIVPCYATTWIGEEGWGVLGRCSKTDSVWFCFHDTSARMRLENQPEIWHDVRPGDLILLPQGAHATIVPEKYPATFTTVHFMALVHGSLNALKVLGFPFVVQSDTEGTLLDASRTLAREYADRSPGWRRAMTIQIEAAILWILRHRGSAFRPFPAHGEGPELATLLPLLNTIETQLDSRDLNVAAIARELCVSDVTLRKLFRHITGMNPNAYIRHCRLTKACTLLRSTTMPIKGVAQECGYRDLAFFYRVFTRAFGKTPVRFRKSGDDPE